MKHVIIPFTVRAQALETVHSIISKFIEAILKNEPGTLLYKSFQQSAEPTKFIHFMTFANQKALEKHRKTKHCKEFVEALYPLCSKMPQAVLCNEIS